MWGGDVINASVGKQVGWLTEDLMRQWGRVLGWTKGHRLPPWGETELTLAVTYFQYKPIL